MATSLLSFVEVPISAPIPRVEILFFASSRSFDFYISQAPITNEKIACAGESTAKHIASKGVNVDFFPVNSGAVQAASLDFATWVAGRSVLFSVSNLSKLSYSKHLEKDHFTVIPTYETRYHSQEIPLCDTYVFTSPSNVDAFFMYNALPADAHVVAWGETTAQHLAEKQIYVGKVLSISDDSALIAYFEEQ